MTIRRVMMVAAAAAWLAGCNCGSDPSLDGGEDAGRPDAGRPDGGRADSGAPDAAVPDAGEIDAGQADAGDLDAGEMDAGQADAGEPDAGAVDAGAPDAGTMDAGDPDAGITPVVELDFETRLPPELDAGSALLTPSQGYAPLGHPGNTFGPTFLRAETGNAITLTVSGLPPHTSLSVDFLFAAIDSLDGTGTFPAGDFFRVDLDGATIFRESFANAVASQIQSYVEPVPEVVLARRVDLGFGGPGGYFTDSAYDLSLDPQFDDWPHSASTATVTFMLEGMGVQSLSDESWAIDNLRITVGNSPRPRPDAGP